MLCATSLFTYSLTPVKQPPIKRPQAASNQSPNEGSLLFLPLFSGQPLLSGHYPFPQWWPF